MDAETQITILATPSTQRRVGQSPHRRGPASTRSHGAPSPLPACVRSVRSAVVTAGLSYIGLGAQPHSPEWGAMLSDGREYLREAWWMSVFPGSAILLAALFVNLLGDGLRDALDPKLSV
jgi:hypothetical protein